MTIKAMHDPELDSRPGITTAIKYIIVTVGKL